MVGGDCLLQRGIAFQGGLDGRLACDGRAESEVAGALGLEQGVGNDAELGEVGLSCLHLGLWNATDEVSLYVLRLRVGSVVHVATDVEVVVVLLNDLRFVHEAAVFRQLAFLSENEVDLFNVLGTELVLVLAFSVFVVGIDKEHLAAQGVGLVFVCDDDTGGDARAVKEAGRQAHDGLDHVVIDEKLADEFFLATPKQHTMGHDGGHVAVWLKAGQHVLDKHEVGLLSGLRAPFAEAGGELQRGAAVIL